MRVLLLCDDSANQRLLAHRLNSVLPLTEIGVISLPRTRKRPPLAPRIANVTLGLPLRRAWFAMLADCSRKAPKFPDSPLTNHLGVNACSVQNRVTKIRPDLVLVSGTNLLRQPLINLIAESGSTLNLHTGISPFIKGGPNCTNWALSLGEFDLIGNSVMWLDSGIDSGALVATERTPLSGLETLIELHIAVMDHAHDLYCRVVGRAAAGLALSRVPQDTLGNGRLFLTKHWTARQIVRAVLNFKRNYGPDAFSSMRSLPLLALDQDEEAVTAA